jgi:hypothetical protein
MEVRFMNLINMLRDGVQYIVEGFLRIFSPDRDEYPVIGLQPFEGEVYDSNSGLNW